MATEIERKFLVSGEAWKTSDATLYRQGYLNPDKYRTVRVRIVGNTAFLTIKGITTGASRAEFEYEVPVADAEQMLTICDGPLIEKYRHLVRHDGMLWEVDEFLGDNLGLVVAEVELQSEDQHLNAPDWTAAEVTGDARYFNSSLAQTPFNSWPSTQ